MGTSSRLGTSIVFENELKLATCMTPLPLFLKRLMIEMPYVVRRFDKPEVRPHGGEVSLFDDTGFDGLSLEDFTGAIDLELS